jgi:hypothetical protein
MIHAQLEDLYFRVQIAEIRLILNALDDLLRHCKKDATA